MDVRDKHSASSSSSASLARAAALPPPALYTTSPCFWSRSSSSSSAPSPVPGFCAREQEKKTRTDAGVRSQKELYHGENGSGARTAVLTTLDEEEGGGERARQGA